MKGILSLILMLGVFSIGVKPSHAELPWQFAEHTRYMVMGDSLGSGYGAIPQTSGYAYQLYKKGAFDQQPNTLFCNASVIGVTRVGAARRSPASHAAGSRRVRRPQATCPDSMSSSSHALR